MKIRELLSDESKWTKGADARLPDGTKCYNDDPLACAWCLEGALFRCYSNFSERGAVRVALRDALHGSDIVTWNDAAARKYAQVKALVDRLDV